MLHVHRAERAEALLDPLARLLGEPTADPFATDVVAVPTKGVERWLAQELSLRLGTGADGESGVCAAVDFASASRLVAGVLARLLGAEADEDPWAEAVLTWTVLDVIDAHLDDPWCATLAHYLRDDAPSRTDPDDTDEADGAPADPLWSRAGRRLAVARQIAALFTTYADQRPQLLTDWADLPEDLTWQRELFRLVRARIGVPGPAERLTGALQTLRDDAEAAGARDLPGRLSVFGPTRLSATHLDVLSALAVHRDVHLWLPHPSPALWQRVSQIERPSPRRAEAQVVARHPLLASMARDSVELQQRLLTLATPLHTDTHHGAGDGSPPGQVPTASATLLEALQAGIVADRDPQPDADAGHLPGLHPLAADDRSVQVHACHGRWRQVEVLREVVLGLLQDDPTLELRDVLVMCPDIEEFAPAVSSVFGNALRAPATGPIGPAHHPGQDLSLRLTDRSLRQTNPHLALLAGLLDLAVSRVEVDAVLDLIASPAVRRRFGFSDDDLERIRSWVGQARLSWGENVRRRDRFGLRHVIQGTWQTALDRLLTGVAMTEDDESGHLGSALPLDDVDSTDIDLAGRLAECVERLELVLAELTGSRPVTAWTATLAHGIDLLALAPAGESWQAAEAKGVLAEVTRSALTHAPTPLTLADIRALLVDRLAGRPTRAGFRTGAITVCSLEPMRSVPHRVICLLGLDDGSFPRAARHQGDDALLRDPYLGERDRRSEDRQLFLDAVMSARQHLVVVYSGADERTGAVKPPAVPVGELLDTLDAVAESAGGCCVRDRIVVRHPLQPVDARNFVPAALTPAVTHRAFSFDAAAARAAQTALTVPRADRSTVRAAAPSGTLLDAPLPPRPREEDDLQVDLDDLVSLLEHPARWFAKRRLGIWLPNDSGDIDPRIPVELDPLSEWAIGDQLLTACLAGVTRDRARAAEQRRGRLPPRALGVAALDVIEGRVRPIAVEAVRHQQLPGTGVDVLVDLPDGRSLAGTVPGVRGDAVVRAVYSRLGPKHRIRAWVQLLALAAAHPNGTWHAVTVGRAAGRRSGAAVATLPPPGPAAAATRLGDLVRLRDRALREPLPMPIGTAHAYARARAGRETVEQALFAADKAWDRERDDAFHTLCWGASASLTVLLATPSAAEQVWAPEDPSRLGVYARRVWDPLLTAEEVGTA